MNAEELSRLLLKFACPFLLVATPVSLFLFFRAPNPPEDHIGLSVHIIVTAISLLITYLSFTYCRIHLGWFGGKRK
jgi:hypothetical protein